MTTLHLNGPNGLNLSAFGNGLSLDEDAGTSKRTNALSNKLTSVLSSSFTDTEVRDALRLLDARSAQNAEDTRTNLKYEAQKEVIAANAKVIDDFGKVAKQLQRVGALITILHQTCDDMKSHIQAAKQETLPMLDEASTLIAAKEETESKRQLLDAFNEHFLVSDSDLTTLTSSAEPVNDRFFVVLDRVKQIRKDCEILLGYENQRLGLELMEQTSGNLDGGYKKLYGWVQREFKGLDLEDPRTSGPIRKSLRALSERPTLFKNCLDFFGEARDVTLSDAFQTALTNSTIGTAKAIEFSTHDPLRYVGDMLAWVHSATVSEKEALEGLFISDAVEIQRGLREGKTNEFGDHLDGTSPLHTGEREGDDAADVSTFDGRAALAALISRSMSSVSQTLQQRASLTIRNLSDPLLIYKMYNLLLFYEDIFIKLLGSSRTTPPRPPARRQSQPQYRNQPTISDPNTILTTFSNLQTQCLTLFTGILNEDVESQPLDPTDSLSPPAVLITNLDLMTSILNLRAPSLTAHEFTNLYSVLVSPVLQLCSEMAEILQGVETEDHDHNHNQNQDQDPGHDHDLESRDNANFEATLFRLNYLFPFVTVFAALSPPSSAAGPSDDIRSSSSMLADLAAAPLQGAKNEIETLQDQLADLLAENFVNVSGVQDLAGLLIRHSSPPTTAVTTTNNAAPSTVDTNDLLGQTRNLLFTNHALEELSSALDTFLASALMDAQDDLAKLSDRGVAKQVISDAVEQFCGEFEKVVRLIEELDGQWEELRRRGGKDESEEMDRDGENEDEDNGDDAILLREVYPRTVGEVRTLLS